MPSLFYRGPTLAKLHNDYAKQHSVDPNAPLVSSSTVEILAPVEAVWHAIAGVEAWAKWAPGVEVLSVAALQPDAKFRWKLNGITIDACFAVVDPPAELSWTGTFFGYRAVDRNLLEQLDGSRTRATFEESLAGPLLPLFYRPTQLQANHERWLRSLKAHAEANL